MSNATEKHTIANENWIRAQKKSNLDVTGANIRIEYENTSEKRSRNFKEIQ